MSLIDLGKAIVEKLLVQLCFDVIFVVHTAGDGHVRLHESSSVRTSRARCDDLSI